MKPKNYLWALAVIALGALAWWATRQRGQSSTLTTDETAFAVADTARVDKIFLAGKDGRTVLLEKTADGWRLNDQYRAEGRAVRDFLATLHDVRVRRPVGKAARDNVIKELATSSRKVEIYQDGQLIKSYYLGNEALDDRGSYGLMAGAEQPYVVHLRGQQGFIHPRYGLNSEAWRSRQVFRTDPADLELLRVYYPATPNESIELKREDGGFAMTGLPNADPGKVEPYADIFRRLHIERYLIDLDQKFIDSLAALTPTAVVTLRERDAARNVDLRLYHHDGDRMFGLLGPPTAPPLPVTVQYYLFDKVLLRRSSFAPAPSTAFAPGS